MPFSQKTLEFLAENRIQDSKDWFYAHRENYEEYVVKPLLDLAQALEPHMLRLDPLLVTEPRVGKAVSRIWRDTRFTKDKSIFREVMWVAYCRDKKEFDSPPGFFFELWPSGFHFGCGYYRTPSKTMQIIRELILQGDPAFLHARDCYEGQKQFALQGEFYKRSKYPDKPPELREWLDRRGLDLSHESRDFDLLFSPGLADTLYRGFLSLKPVYDFFWKAQALANGA